MPQIAILSAELVTHTPDPLQVIESAGRICYKSEDRVTKDSAEDFVRKILLRGHEAVLEHASATFHIICDRGVSHEAVRHRLASFCQESTRYCNYGNEKFGGQITVIEPPFTHRDNGCPNECPHHIWETAVKAAEEAYNELLGLGQPPQIARSVLPICLKTEIMLTANMREWRHILRLRTDKAAHPQIREVMGQVLEVFTTKWPVLVEDLV